MIQKKILTISRDSGSLVSTTEAEPAQMTEDEYFRPFVELYQEAIDRLRIKQEEKP